MSWRERYKNNEARFDHHIKAFQYKNKLSRQPVPVGFGAMSVDGMEDLNDFGTDEEEENRRAQQKRAARVDSDSDDLDDLDEELVSTQSGDGSKAIAAPKHPASKRKRVSDTNDRTSKRSRVTEDSESDKMQGGNHTGGEEGDVMDQDSQGEETFEIEQNLLHLSDEDSLITPRLVLFSCVPFQGSIFSYIIQQVSGRGHTKATRPNPSIRWFSCIHFRGPSHFPKP